MDKCNRKWVLVGMDLMQSVIMLTVGVLAYMGKLNVTGVLIAAFLAALGTVFYSPAVSTLMIDIIPHDDMVRGQSMFSSVNSLINMVGTAFSGVMVAFFGVPLIVVMNGLSNLYSAITELYGFLGDIFPMYLLFALGSAISLVPMIYLCFHPRTKTFVLTY